MVRYYPIIEYMNVLIQYVDFYDVPFVYKMHCNFEFTALGAVVQFMRSSGAIITAIDVFQYGSLDRLRTCSSFSTFAVSCETMLTVHQFEGKNKFIFGYLGRYLVDGDSTAKSYCPALVNPQFKVVYAVDHSIKRDPVVTAKMQSAADVIRDAPLEEEEVSVGRKRNLTDMLAKPCYVAKKVVLRDVDLEN